MCFRNCFFCAEGILVEGSGRGREGQSDDNVRGLNGVFEFGGIRDAYI